MRDVSCEFFSLRISIDRPATIEPNYQSVVRFALTRRMLNADTTSM